MMEKGGREMTVVAMSRCLPDRVSGPQLAYVEGGREMVLEARSRRCSDKVGRWQRVRMGVGGKDPLNFR
jgi:hypothetical protein